MAFMCYSELQHVRGGEAYGAKVHLQDATGDRTACGVKTSPMWYFMIHDNMGTLSCERCLKTIKKGDEHEHRDTRGARPQR